MKQARVYLIPPECILAVLKGEKRVCNLPADAELVAAQLTQHGIGVRVHSKTFPVISCGSPLPLVTAALERCA